MRLHFLILFSFLLNLIAEKVSAQTSLEGFPNAIYTNKSHSPSKQKVQVQGQKSTVDFENTNNKLNNSMDPLSTQLEVQIQNLHSTENVRAPAKDSTGTRQFFPDTNNPFDRRSPPHYVAIEIAPAIVYNDSQSSYSYRSYTTFFDAMRLSAQVWLTPRLGLSGQYLFSRGAKLDDSNQTKVPTHYENLDFGFHLRNVFPPSNNITSWDFSLLYSDNNTKVSNDSTLHPKLRSTGLGIGVRAHLPLNYNHAWYFGGNIFPKLQHSESATAINASSGSSTENTRIGFNVGGEWSLSKRDTLVIDLGLSAEKNYFSGSANLPDSNNGRTPTNVTVNNNLYMLNLAYRWGH